MAALDNLLFGDYTVPDLLQEDRAYKEVPDVTKLDAVILSYITDYNNTNKTRLHLILFGYYSEFIHQSIFIYIKLIYNFTVTS